MEGRLPACHQLHSAVLQASAVEQAEYMLAADMQEQAAGMTAAAADMTAVPEHPEADIRPVRQGYLTSCQVAGVCLL